MNGLFILKRIKFKSTSLGMRVQLFLVIMEGETRTYDHNIQCSDVLINWLKAETLK